MFGDGEQSRDFTYVDNVVEANLLALDAKDAPGEIFNIGCGAQVSLNDLIRKLEAILGVRAKVDYQPARPGDVRDSLAAIDLAQQHLGYTPQVSIDEGLKKTVAAFKTNPTEFHR